MKAIAFSELNIGMNFKYDGDMFVKTDNHIAWEIRRGRKYKEWAFVGDELVVQQ